MQLGRVFLVVCGLASAGVQLTAIAFANEFAQAKPLNAVKNSSWCYFDPTPKYAALAGTNKPIFDICPTLSSVNLSATQTSGGLFNGAWWSNTRPAISLYKSVNGILQMRLGAGVTSVSPQTMKPSFLPLLSGEKSFYIEFSYSLSDNDADHWPAVWLMPAEHNAKEDDHYTGDPEGFERFNEIDVDEGGFNVGAMSSAISWRGIWPNYSRSVANNWNNKISLDRTNIHKFAALYNPSTLTISYFCDDRPMFIAKSPNVDPISKKQHFYIIICAQSHGKNIDYGMNIIRVRAYTLS